MLYGGAALNHGHRLASLDQAGFAITSPGARDGSPDVQGDDAVYIMIDITPGRLQAARYFRSTCCTHVEESAASECRCGY